MKLFSRATSKTQQSLEGINYRIPKLVSSIEGVITESTNNTPEIRHYHESMDAVFAISECIRDSAEKYWGMNVPVLPLGVREIAGCGQEHDSIRKVIWVGNIKANKRPRWLIEIAKCFPKTDFLMIGDGDLQDEIDGLIAEYGLNNVKRTGRITNEKVYEYMSQSDLLLMTSEYEGLPKVIQEAAQCGVPSIYINQNYSVDFIEDGTNGYAVSDLEEMKDRISYLIMHPDQYVRMSKEAAESIKPYLWPVLIKQYEDYFESLVQA